MIQTKGRAARLLRLRAAHSGSPRALKTRVKLKLRRPMAPLARAGEVIASCKRENTRARQNRLAYSPWRSGGWSQNRSPGPAHTCIAMTFSVAHDECRANILDSPGRRKAA